MQVAWFLLAGSMLVLMAFAARWVQRLPLSPAIAYMTVGYALGPGGAHYFTYDLQQHALPTEILAEVAVLISLFAVGLRLQPVWNNGWRAALRLAGIGVAVTTVLAATAAWAVLGLSVAAALLLAAVLSPTDPVLASEVQVKEAGDRDAVRLALTAEGGLNDGTAFPAVMLALGLFGVHSLGDFGWRWVAVDLFWAVSAALLLGWACGWSTGWLLHRLRRTTHLPRNEEFLVLGVIAVTYGATLLIHAYGFVAVFVAALALAHAERARPVQRSHDDVTHSSNLIHFTGQCERLLEMAVVVLVGVALGNVAWSWPLVAFALIMLLIVRPFVVFAVVPKHVLSSPQRRLAAWFGIRGIGSIYYIAYAITHGAPWDAAKQVVDATLVTIALSVLLHGISATPVMAQYQRLTARRKARRPAA
jgi:sodium/hydrogen antiporter